jgi:hypothetical protein
MTTVENDAATEMAQLSSQAVSPRKTKASLDRDMHGRFLDLRSLDVGSKQGET